MATEDYFSPGDSPVAGGRVTVAQRPLEAGIYGWGWVEYFDYEGPRAEPRGLSVVIFEEVLDRKTVKSFHRLRSLRSWIVSAMLYGPASLGLLLMLFGDPVNHPWIGQITLLLIGWTLWNALKISRHRKRKYQIIQDYDEYLEGYSTGREFLRALTHEGLLKDDPYAHFNLFAAARDYAQVRNPHNSH